ncbi:site-specific DNA-methyltransferase, partial [Candidatus Dojkabacteria bacterium]|nr:site-specific DNA-methyltransferase [Candidatus Dojkabacteria bacterium]
KSFSNENDIVLDPFAGSGTVGVVCKDLNRKFILIEKDENNIELIKLRLI